MTPPRKGRSSSAVGVATIAPVENSTLSPEKLKALQAALDGINKQFGAGAIMRLDSDEALKVETIPTGILGLDLALGVGGLPRGRVVEIYGPESGGKTTTSLHLIAEAQKTGGTCAFIDAEHAFPTEFAKSIGINLSDLLFSQPDTGEQALEICEALVRSGAVDVVVVDSVAALVPRAELEGEMGDAHVGLQARLMSQALRKLTGVVAKSKTICVFINQLREKVGVMFGNPETTPGGRALKFYSSVRLDVRKIEQIKDGTQVIGHRGKIKVVKNKVAAPFKECEVDFMYGKGISREGSLLDVALERGYIEKIGSWYSYGDTRLGQGRENSKQFLADNPEFCASLEARIREDLKSEPLGTPSADESSEGLA